MAGCLTALLVALGLAAMPLLLGHYGFVLAGLSWGLMAAMLWIQRRISRRPVPFKQDAVWLSGVLLLTLLVMTVTFFLPLALRGF